jgi:acetyltransferase EpsM
MSRLAIIGTGGHARECIEAARAVGHEIVGLLDEDSARWNTKVLGITVSDGGLSAATGFDGDVEWLIAVGDNRARSNIATRLPNLSFATLIHPFSWISPSASIAPGAMIFAGCVVQSGVSVGQHAIMNTSSSLSHDCVAGDFCHVAVGVHLAGNVTVGQGAIIGAGVTARPGVMVGNWATIGAGSALVSDIPDGATAYGDANAVPR